MINGIANNIPKNPKINPKTVIPNMMTNGLILIDFPWIIGVTKLDSTTINTITSIKIIIDNVTDWLSANKMAIAPPMILPMNGIILVIPMINPNNNAFSSPLKENITVEINVRTNITINNPPTYLLSSFSYSLLNAYNLW